MTNRWAMPGGFGRLGFAAALIAAAGCTSQPTQTTAQYRGRTEERSPSPGKGQPVGVDATRKGSLGVTQISQIRAAVRPLGVVPYDNMTLAIVSPDASRVATQAGAGPTWPTALAEHDARVPSATRIEIYTLDMRDGIEDKLRQPPARSVTLDESVLLGHSCDAEGFLIESPREDGSRWIGKASWQTGAITWLVQDEQVNAFATLGPGGRLAWARRTITADHFDLVVRVPAGEWTLPANGDDWVMPTWSDSGQYLFAFHLEGQALDLRFGLAESAQSFEQSIRTLALLDRGTIYQAYQAMNGTCNVIGVRQPASEQIVFFHPGIRRSFLWRPLAIADRSRAPMNPGSFAALVDEDDVAYVATQKDLVRQSLVNPRDRANIVAGQQVPRPTSHPEWSCMLLAPAEGRIALTALRLLPPNAAGPVQPAFK